MIHSLKPDLVTFRQERTGLRLHEPHTRVDAHVDLALQPARDPEELPAHGRLRRQHLQAGQCARDVLVKYHWKTQQGIESLTQAQADEIQATDLGSASKDIFEAIERGDFPRWELNVQIMSDDEHVELDWDPLDDTKTWPEDEFPLLPVGMMLDRNVSNFFAENEQVAFGTGVLVDGLDFSDDKMLVGRTFSYSTPALPGRANYLQLPVNAPLVRPATNQRDGQMAYYVDDSGEPARELRAQLDGRARRVARGRPRTTDHQRAADADQLSREHAQPGERYRTMPDAGAGRTWCST